jgi:hypothetical protein
MKINSNYQEHVSIMKELKMPEGFYEVREPYKEDFEEIYDEAKEKGIGVSNAKEFLNSLSKEELSTLQNYTRLADEINIGSLSDEGAYNLLLHHYEKYDFNKDGIREDGISKTKGFIPESLDSTTKKALVETYNNMDFKDVMMSSFMMFPPNIRIENGQIIDGGYKEYSYEDIKNNINNILGPKSLSGVSAEFKNTLREFLAALEENYHKAKEEELLLESYTRNTKQNPLENLPSDTI